MPGASFVFSHAPPCPAVAQVCGDCVPGLPKPGGLATEIRPARPTMSQVKSIPAGRRQKVCRPAAKITQTGNGKDRQGLSSVVSRLAHVVSPEPQKTFP